MPFILLAIGLIFAVIGLYRFFLRANAKQIKALLLAIGALAVFMAALTLALTGRLPAAIAILVALWPLAVAWLRQKKTSAPPSFEGPLSEKEAYDVLGLEQGASAQDIKDAHIRLMKKLHPDQKGSDWLAQKINAAKELLLNSRV